MRIQLNCGQFNLTLAEADGSLWIGATAACTVDVSTELFGVGSGGFVKQSEATDTMSDSSAEGRWVAFSINDASTLVVLEKTRQEPEHLQRLSFWNKASTLSLKSNMFLNTNGLFSNIGSVHLPTVFGHKLLLNGPKSLYFKLLCRSCD